jgi:hypothetical protein
MLSYLSVKELTITTILKLLLIPVALVFGYYFIFPRSPETRKAEVIAAAETSASLMGSSINALKEAAEALRNQVTPPAQKKEEKVEEEKAVVPDKASWCSRCWEYKEKIGLGSLIAGLVVYIIKLRSAAAAQVKTE